MSRPVRPAALLAVLLCMGSSGWAADDPLPSREAIAKTAKASTVLVVAGGSVLDKSGKLVESSKIRYSFGSGFCVHSSGLFVTCEHVLHHVSYQSPETVYLVLNMGEKTQKVLKAKVLRRDTALDLAILKVDGEKFEALQLGTDKDLVEMAEVTACGCYPWWKRGAMPRGNKIFVGKVSSLRRDREDKLNRIQLDAVFDLSNSGGPVLDKGGKVVGMVECVEIENVRFSNQSIPVSILRRFLAQPAVVLTLPAVTAANRHVEVEFTAQAISVLPGKPVTDLELVLSAGPGKERRFPMKLADGTFRAKAVPFPARVGPPVCRVEVKYEDGSSISGTTKDRTIRVGDKEFKLSQLRRMRLGPKPGVLFADGLQLDKIPDGLKDSPLKVGNQSLPLDLTGAAEVKVEMPEEATVLLCSVLMRQDGEEVRRSGVPLYIEGVSGPVAGTIMGAKFKADTVELQAGVMLILKSGEDSIGINFRMKPDKAVYETNDQDKKADWEGISLDLPSALPPFGFEVDRAYVMRLEFGKEKNGKIPGKLYLQLSGGRGSIAGTFTVTYE